ncbi:MAG: Acetyl-coenzyme A synthetase [Citrobacter braakii]
MLLSLGVQRGDRVLVYMPMIAEAHITLLACARIGAIHSVVFGGFASHSVAARIDDARPVVIVSADAGRAAARSCPIKSYSMMRSIRLSISRVMWCWSTAVWRKWRGWRGVTSTLPRYANSISAHGCRLSGWSSNETSCILYTSGTTGKPKGVQRDVGGYAVALATSMDTISAAKRAACSSARRISAGWLGIPISCMRRCWRDGDGGLRRAANVSGLRRMVENC